MYVWGSNEFGQLGQGVGRAHYPGAVSPEPVPVLSDVRSVSAGFDHTVAVRGDGTLYGWGWGIWGALGVNQDRSVDAPLRMPFRDVLTAEAGNTFTVIGSRDGSLWAAGVNGSGQLGQGSVTPYWNSDDRPNPGPVRVVGIRDVRKVSAGGAHVLALGSSEPIPSGRPPSEPTNIRTDPGDGTMTVSWDPPADDGGLPLTGYIASVGGKEPDGTGLFVAHEPIHVGPGTRSVTFRYPNGSSLYKIGVTANNAAGTSARAAIAVDVAGRPDTVSSVRAESGVEQVTISWPAPDSNGAPITKYRVLVKPDSRSMASWVVREVDGSTQSVTLGPAEGACNRTDRYFVVAVNSWGYTQDSPLSNTTTATCKPDWMAEPTGKSSTNGVDLSWEPAGDNGSPLLRYEISGGPAVTTVAPTATSATITDLQSAQSYRFRIRAVNALGAGAWSWESDLITAGPEARSPGRPTAVTATAGDGSAMVQWQRPPNVDGIAPVRSNEVLDEYGHVRARVGDVESAEIPGLTNGYPVRFTVVARNASGWAHSEPSNPVTPAPAATRPTSPTEVRSTAGDGSATVSWQPPTSSGGAVIDRYTVTVNPGARQIVTSGTSTQVTGLANGTNYSVSVTAHNSVGDGPAATANVTPKAFGRYHPGKPSNGYATGSSPLSSTAPRDVPIAGIPANATAVVVNAQIVNPTAAGYLRLGPAGTTPTTSNVFFAKGQRTANLAVVPVVNGKARLALSAGTATVYVDVFGYYTADAIGDGYTPVKPSNGYATGASPLSSTVPRDVTIAGIPANATAVVVNAQVVNPTAAGYLRLGPAGTTPTTSNVFFTRGQRTANLAVVPVVNGKARLALSAGTATVYLDVFGYHSPDATGDGYTPVKPAPGYATGSAPLSSAAPRDVPIAGIPANATAVVVNAQVVNPTAAGYLRLGPAGTTPTTSNVFFAKGQRTANLAVVPVVNGKARLALSAGTATVYLDVFGYHRR